MPTPTKSHVVKITGVPDEMLRLIDERVKSQHFGGRAEYVRELIRRDILKDDGPTFREILAPIDKAIPEMSEEEIDNFFEPILEEVYAARHNRSVP